LIAQVVAIAAPPLVTAAVPRELRLPAVALAKAGIDPCEKKKTKRREFARRREGDMLPGLPAGRYHCHGVSIAHLLIRQRRGEVLEKLLAHCRSFTDQLGKPTGEVARILVGRDAAASEFVWIMRS